MKTVQTHTTTHKNNLYYIPMNPKCRIVISCDGFYIVFISVQSFLQAIKQQYLSRMFKMLLLFIIGLVVSCKKYTCAFGQLYHNSTHYKRAEGKVDQMEMNSQRRVLLSVSRSPMRITLQDSDFDTIKTDNGQPITTQDNLDFILRAMQVTEHFYETRLQVTPMTRVYPPATCLDHSISASDQSNGFAATDLLIYVLYISDDTITYGATGVSCKWVNNGVIPDTTLSEGRPTVGRIIFNTHTLVDQEPALTNRLFASVTATAIHEVMHILGFDQSLYSTYLDPTDGSLYSSTTSSSTLHASRTGGANYLLQTPYVTAWAQNFFGCGLLTGMVLENEEGHSNPGSHWERLTMYDELMTGTELGAQKSFSGLTFAILKDMGWYEVDDTFNDTTNYGFNKGCSFVEDACYAASPDDKYFCDTANYVNTSVCSTTFLGKAVCSNTATLMADGCGLFGQYFHCVDPDTNDDGYQQYTLEQYSTESFCVQGTLSTVGVTEKYRSRCYPYVCHAQNNSIEFTVGTYSVVCLSNEEGVTKTVSALDGYLQCPVFEDFCTESRKICPNWCSQNGFCTRGVCNCLPGFSGDDCSVTKCASNKYYNPASNNCVTDSNCPSGYYQNQYSKTCMPCHSSCDECRDEDTICTSCVSTGGNPQYYYDTNNQCVSECPANTYQSIDNCFDCDVGSNCQTCSGTATNCTSCINSDTCLADGDCLYLSQPTAGSCGAVCSGTYATYDNVNFQCVQTCPVNLETYDGNKCRYCISGYKMPGGSCLADCGTGFYEDDADKFCGTCDDSCKECSGEYPENCTQCKTTGAQIFLYLGMCVSSCPNGYYGNETSGVCEICTIGLFCAKCYMSSMDDNVYCQTCIDGYYYQANETCTAGCDQYMFKNQWKHICEDCDSDCGDCTSAYDSSCINCRNGSYFLSNSTGGYCLGSCPSEGYVTDVDQCSPCHETCSSCNGLTSADCHSCKAGLYLQDGYCRYVCSPGKFANTSTYECKDCHSKCSFCFGSTVDNCTACANNYVLDNFTCADSCPTGYEVHAEYSVCQLKQTVSEIHVIFSAFLLVLLGFLL